MEKPKVMVALRDEETAESLTTLACQMAHLMGASVSALHVIEVAPGLPIDANDLTLSAPGERVLAMARQVAAKNYAMQLAPKLLNARHAGQAIVEEVKDQGAELLVIGYHHNHGLAETLLGSTVQYVSHHAPCRVLVQIPPQSARRRASSDGKAAQKNLRLA
jgi:nucleotide-binding universal stress UspA family protein